MGVMTLEIQRHIQTQCQKELIVFPMQHDDPSHVSELCQVINRFLWSALASVRLTLSCVATTQGRHAADGGQVEPVVAPKHQHVRQPAAADVSAGFAAGGHSSASAADANAGSYFAHPPTHPFKGTRSAPLLYPHSHTSYPCQFYLLLMLQYLLLLLHCQK